MSTSKELDYKDDTMPVKHGWPAQPLSMLKTKSFGNYSKPTQELTLISMQTQ